MSEIILKRKPAYFGAARKMKVWINGDCVGRVGIGKEENFPTPSGEVEIKVSMDWCKSKPYKVQVEKGETIKVIAETQFFLLAMFSTFFRPSALFRLSAT